MLVLNKSKPKRQIAYPSEIEASNRQTADFLVPNLLVTFHFIVTLDSAKIRG
jgi:hypothetical protein